jgi:serine acetyltransferase
MIEFLRRAYHQWHYRTTVERPASRWAKLRLSWRFDCYVSPAAHVYHPKKVQLARDVQICERATVGFRSAGAGNAVNLWIGAGTKVMPEAMLLPRQGTIRIGRNVSINYGCILYGVGSLEIGDDTRIGAHTIITPMNHVFADANKPIRLQGETAVGIRIGSDVWLGSDVKIVDGVEIGNGCVVGAGSVVTKSLPPFSVAVGSPARVIRKRGAGESAGAAARLVEAVR